MALRFFRRIVIRSAHSFAVERGFIRFLSEDWV